MSQQLTAQLRMCRVRGLHRRTCSSAASLRHKAGSSLLLPCSSCTAWCTLCDSVALRVLSDSSQLNCGLPRALGPQVYKLYGGPRGFMICANVSEPDAHHAATLFHLAKDLHTTMQLVSWPGVWDTSTHFHALHRAVTGPVGVAVCQLVRTTPAPVGAVRL